MVVPATNDLQPLEQPVSATVQAAQTSATFSQILRQTMWSSVTLAAATSSTAAVEWTVKVAGSIVGNGTGPKINLGPFLVQPGTVVEVIMTGNPGDTFNGTLSGWCSTNQKDLPAGNLTATGSFYVSGGTINIGTISGTVTISGAVTVSGGTINVGTVSGTVTVAGSVTITSGTVNVGTVSGTVTIAGAVTVSSGTVNIGNTVTITGAVTISSGTVNVGTISGTVTISGAVTISSGSVTVTSGTINIGTGPADVTASANLNVLGRTVSVALAGVSGAGFSVPAGTLNCTVVGELSFDGGTTWISTTFFDPAAGTTASSVVFSGSNPAVVRTILTAAGATNARIRVSAYTSGSLAATVKATSVQTPSVVIGGSPTVNIGNTPSVTISSGTVNIGSITAGNITIVGGQGGATNVAIDSPPSSVASLSCTSGSAGPASTTFTMPPNAIGLYIYYLSTQPGTFAVSSSIAAPTLLSFHTDGSTKPPPTPVYMPGYGGSTITLSHTRDSGTYPASIALATAYAIYAAGEHAVANSPQTPLYTQPPVSPALLSKSIQVSVAASGTSTVIAAVAGSTITIWGVMWGIQPNNTATTGLYQAKLEGATSGIVASNIQLRWASAAGQAGLRDDWTFEAPLPLQVGEALRINAGANAGTIDCVGVVLYTQG